MTWSSSSHASPHGLGTVLSALLLAVWLLPSLNPAFAQQVFDSEDRYSSSITLDDEVLDDQRSYQVVETFASQNTEIASGASVTVRSGGTVRLKSGFHATDGSTFRALIDPSLQAAPNAPTNDPLYGLQTALRASNADGAWAITKGSASQVLAVVGGGNVRPTHEDLTSKTTIQERSVFGDFNAPVPFDRMPVSATATAGLAAAQTNNGTGIAGMNWNAQIYSYDPSTLDEVDTGNGTFYSFHVTDIGQADDDVRSAVDDGADVIAMPFVAFENSPSVEFQTTLDGESVNVGGESIPGWLFDLGRSAFNYIRDLASFNDKWGDAWAALFYAAANDRPIFAPIGDFFGSGGAYPSNGAGDKLAISVGSIGSDGSSVYYSGSSTTSDPDYTTLDFVAPGTDALVPSQLDDQVYRRMSSTVVSTGLSAGVGTLIRDADPSITAEGIRQILRRTAVDVGDPGFDTKTGFGMVDAQRALEFVQNRSITQGTVTNGSKTKIDTDRQLTLVGGFWTNLASGTYFTDDFYRVRWTISLPPGADHDIWVRPVGTDGWSAANPQSGEPWADIDVRSYESEATITTYVYEGETYDVLGRLIGTYGYPVGADDAKVAYTIATKPGDPPPAPLSVSLTGSSSLYSGDPGSWTASVSGGEGSTSYAWSYRTCSTCNWVSTSETSSTYSRSFFNGDSTPQYASVRVTVTRGSETRTATQGVSVLAECSDGRLSTKEDATSSKALAPCIKRGAQTRLPQEYRFEKPSPHPVSGASTMELALPKATDVSLVVYDVMGRRIATLVDESLGAGFHTVQLDASRWQSGAYLYRLDAGSELQASGRFTVVR